MARNRIHILIVDDDATQGKALQETFSRAGYKAYWYPSSIQGLTAAQRQEFHCLFIDCMLPKMNGMDLIEEIQSLASSIKPKTFMYSGIFRDKGFIKETIEKTKALRFFLKPLNLEEVLKAVDEAFKDEIAHSEPPLLSLYHQEKMSAPEVVTLIRRESAIPTFHLPMLYRRLQSAKVNGELSMVDSEGDTAAIGFQEGQIFSVRTNDKSSFFGALAVEFGFVSPEEVMSALQSQEKKLLGQKLIDSMSLSPHNVQVIMGEQLALRLSQTIRSGVVSVQWTETSYPLPECTLAPERFEVLIREWSESKFDINWLKANLAMWGNFGIFGVYHDRIKNATSIQSLINHPEFKAETDLPILFRRLVSGQATLGTLGENKYNFEILDQRLEVMIENYKRQNYFQILGVREKSHAAEVIRAYEELKDFFDPANLPSNSPPASVVKCTIVFQTIEEAYQTLVDDIRRLAYLSGLQRKRQNEIFAQEPVFRAALFELQRGNALGAVQKLQSIIDLKVEFRDLRSYRIWAGLKLSRHYSSITLEMIPPEERHSAPYMMALGVYNQTRGSYRKALESYRKAQMLDPMSSIAKVELEALLEELRTKGGQQQLMKEVAYVIESFFGKSNKRGA